MEPTNFEKHSIQSSSEYIGISRMMNFKLAKKYLCAPCGNSASEREFSTASDIANFDRNRLSPENVNKLPFLKYGLRAIGFNTFFLTSNLAHKSYVM